MTQSDMFSYPPRGLGREEAARYLGISASKFDQLVAERRMPPPKQIDGRSVWDRMALDAAFTELPTKISGGLSEKADKFRR